MEQLFDLVRTIPKGKCASYGDLGRALDHPASGYMVGRWMAQCPEDVPWWRVVGKDGRLPLHKRDPRLADEQQRRLQKEGVRFEDGQVEMGRFGWEVLSVEH